ncbi:hypothetical protein UA08_08915 [Talaromyces atroroseus]|uniref:Uncharacterized protein n=1 Tax=Talaromyces atroroseus TaxID=1441469 RepID=A0A225AR47_TALAT|nr:hypothetical protein UA08_08915 [Talaromyces atroroseus]OKL55927.1 hypothetical protein UA08_08915 [Talaromyces atroroseus]
MQPQVDLLFKSKILNAPQPSNGSNQKSAISIDLALSLVEEGMKTWQMPIMCHSCRCNDDHEVILLAFMSIQSIARYFQRLISQSRGETPGTTRFVNLDECPIKTQVFTIGSFQITGDNRLLLLTTLLINTVQKLEWVLTSLQKVLEEKSVRFALDQTNGTEDTGTGSMSGDLFHIQQMFSGLSRSLKSLEEYLSP